MRREPRPHRKRALLIAGVCVVLFPIALVLPSLFRAPATTTGEIYEAIIFESGIRPNVRVSQSQLSWSDDFEANAGVLIKQGTLTMPPLPIGISKGTSDYLSKRSLPVLDRRESEDLTNRIADGAEGELWTFSEPVMTPGRRAVVKGEIYCGMMCAGGCIYVLDRSSGSWKVVDTIVLWQS